MNSEELIQTIKRQAIDELRKATSAADQKANEKIAADRRQYEARLLEAYSLFNVQEDRPENCKNCGRRAANVCSGCQRVQYCGAFCQHRFDFLLKKFFFCNFQKKKFFNFFRDWQRHRMFCKVPQSQPVPLPVQTSDPPPVAISKVIRKPIEDHPAPPPPAPKPLEQLERPNPTKSA